MQTDDVIDETSIDEDLEDLQDWNAGAVLWSTDWTVETVLSQLRRGNIDLNPRFQRRSAWRDNKQSLFIESLILGLPIPQIILAEDRNRRGSYIVIDGKQRLLSIRRFVSQDDDMEFKPLKLRKLENLSKLNNQTYPKMLENDNFRGDVDAFDNATVRTIVIKNWQSEAYLYQVFLRINTGSVQLAPQELRQALHPGPFSDFIDEVSAESLEIHRVLNIDEPDFRMRDAELLLRYYAYKNFSRYYTGNLKKFLDDTTKKLNASWNNSENLIINQAEEFEVALEFIRNLFGEKNYLRKWNGVNFEGRKNRAVMDIMLFYFSNPNVRNASENRYQPIVDKFIEMCEDDIEFIGSIERTTKSIEANVIRFLHWGDALEEILQINIDKPELG